MGLFERLRGASRDDAPRATAIVTASANLGDRVVRNEVIRDYEVHANELNAIGIGKIKHELTLDVHVPGRAPFEVSGRFNVPAKATGRSGYTLPVGLELPVDVDDDNNIEVDWKAFLASPDRKAQIKRAAAEDSAQQATAYTNAVPGMKDQAWASAATGMPMWMQAVRDGKMKRKAFNQQVDALTRIGQMDPELAAQGKATLDAEGWT